MSRTPPRDFDPGALTSLSHLCRRTPSQSAVLRPYDIPSRTRAHRRHETSMTATLISPPIFCHCLVLEPERVKNKDTLLVLQGRLSILFHPVCCSRVSACPKAASSWPYNAAGVPFRVYLVVQDLDSGLIPSLPSALIGSLAPRFLFRSISYVIYGRVDSARNVSRLRPENLRSLTHAPCPQPHESSHTEEQDWCEKNIRKEGRF